MSSLDRYVSERRAAFSQVERIMWHQVKGRPTVFTFTAADFPAGLVPVMNTSERPSFVDVDDYRLVLGAGEQLDAPLKGKPPSTRIGLGAGVRVRTAEDDRRKGELF